MVARLKMERVRLMSKKSAKNLVFFALGLGFISSCGQNSADSQLKHNHGEPVRPSSMQWNWSAVKEADHEKFVLDGSAPNGFVPTSSYLVKRSQYWVDQIDSKIRAAHPTEMAQVPRPLVKVIKEDQFNAFIAGVYSCFNLSIEVAERTGHRDQGLFVDLAEGGELTRWNDDDPDFPVKCVADADKATLVKALDAFNARGLSCQFTLEGNKVVASADCPLASDMDDEGGVAAGGKLVIARTSSWVNIYSGLIEQLPNEEQFVAVIAHELGHYYRSHITSSAADYGYYYSMGDHNPGQRPIADSELQSFGEEVYGAAEVINSDSLFAKIEGQKISAKMYLAAGDLARQVCAAGGCSSECSAVANLVKDKAYKRNNGIYPFVQVPKSTSQYFSSFEANAVACLENLPYAPNGKVTPVMVATAMASPVWFGASDGQDYYPADALSLIRDILAQVASRAGKIEDADNALELIYAYGKLLDEQSIASIGLMTQAQERRLGQYTAEQEADELSVEWTTMVGLSPKSMVMANMTMASLGGGDDEMGGFVIGGDRCKTLFDADWKDKDGSQVFVPVGDYSEDHHSACFRAFNAYRELSAHNYAQKSKDGSVPPGGSWEKIKAEAAKVNTRVRWSRVIPWFNRANVQKSFVGRDMDRLNSCVFSQSMVK